MGGGKKKVEGPRPPAHHHQNLSPEYSTYYLLVENAVLLTFENCDKKYNINSEHSTYKIKKECFVI